MVGIRDRALHPRVPKITDISSISYTVVIIFILYQSIEYGIIKIKTIWEKSYIASKFINSIEIDGKGC